MDGKDLLEVQAEREAERTDIRKKYPADWPAPILEQIFYGRMNKSFVDNRRLIMDANTGYQWDVVSDQYQLVYHEDVLSNLLEAIPDEFGTPEIKIMFWKDGARFRATATFPDLKDFEVKKGDPIRPRVIYKNSYDRSSFLKFEYGAVQLVCSNGLVAYKKEEEAAQKHLGEVNIENLSDIIKEKIGTFGEQLGIWQKWTELPIQEDLVVVAKKMPFSAKEQEKLLVLPLINNEGRTLQGLGSSATLWDLNSASTQFAAHEVKGFQRSMDLEGEIAKTINTLAETR